MLDAATTQQIALLLNTANANYNAAAARNDHASATAAADLINCYRAALNQASFVPWTGYQLPTNCTQIAPVTLPPATTTPGQLVQPQIVTAPPSNGGTAVSNLPPAKPAYITDCLPEEVQYCCYYPGDPLCVGGFEGGYGNTGSGGGTVINNYYDTYNTYNTTNGESPADVNNLVDGALSSLWSVVVSAVDSTLAALVATIQAVINTLGNALKSVFSTLASLAGLIIKALQSIWQGVVKALATLVRNLVTLLKDLWDKVLVPLLKAIQELRQWLLQLYQRYLRPLLIIIQNLRQFLSILRILHVKWAGKLDQVLSDIQSRITAPLFFLLSYSNALANWINLIITAGYLFQRPVWLASLGAYKGASVGLVVNSMTTPFDPLHPPAAAAVNGLPSTATSDQAGLTYMHSGSGPYQSLADQQTAQFQAYLNGGL